MHIICKTEYLLIDPMDMKSGLTHKIVSCQQLYQIFHNSIFHTLFLFHHTFTDI